MKIANKNISAITILIVDDNKVNVKLVEKLIEDTGANIVTCFNGKEALEFLKENRADIIVTDLMMPELDGFQLISKVREDIGNDIYIIITTVLENSEDKVKGLELGANDYITKPFNKREFKSRIRIGIREALLKKELIALNHILKKREKDLSAALKEIKKNQALLIHQEKMASFGVLAAGVAHEINNPATFVNVNAATMEKWWKLFEPIFDKAIESGWDIEPALKKLPEMLTRFPKMIQSIKEGAARNSSITSGLKEFARSDNGKRQLVDIRQALEAAMIMTKNYYKYHADLVIENTSEIPKIYGNSQKLEQVFVNMIINAADATEEKVDIMRDRGQPFQGLISIVPSLKKTLEGSIEIVVKDNGVGMDADAVGKVFDPFFTTKPLKKGTGLGMSIVHGIIEDHGGSISIESTKGEGTAFTIALPLEQRKTVSKEHGG